MKNQIDGELRLTNYLGKYIQFILLVLGYLFIFLIVIYPGIYNKNLFVTFIELYESKNFFTFLGLIGFIGLSIYTTVQFFTDPFKITFSEEGIQTHSLQKSRSCFIEWKDLNEFRFIKLVRRRYQIETKYMRLVLASNKFSTKILGSLGPTFELGDFKNDNAANVEKILELYEKKCPQLGNSEGLQNE